MYQRGMNRWGMGGARVEEVHLGDIEEDHLDVRIVFEATELDRAVFCVGFIDESGREVGAAASPAVPVPASNGEITCSIRPLPLRSGIYFPVVAILSEDGVVRDRWQLVRSLVVERNGDGTLPEGFGAVDLAAGWSSEDGRAREHG
jgi:hypothetical protein